MAGKGLPDFCWAFTLPPALAEAEGIAGKAWVNLNARYKSSTRA